MTREDPDFHQRFVATVEPDRILGRWDASQDFGKTWMTSNDGTELGSRVPEPGDQGGLRNVWLVDLAEP
jgi:hypothetical protein